MSLHPVPILYEDERSDIKQFGLHELIVSCIADERGQQWWELRGQFDAVPLKGDSKLLAACGDVSEMPDSLIFAIFDSDKLHRRLFGSGKPTHDDLFAELRRRCPDPRLHVFLLEHNTETVVDAAARCLGEVPPDKDKLLRDRILNRAATGARQLRDCVREAVPSFDHCIRQIAELSAPLLRRP